MLRVFVVATLFCTTSYASKILGDLVPRKEGACTAGPQDPANIDGKYFGTATKVSQWGDQKYTDILDDCSIFGSLTPAAGMKWEDTEPNDNQFTWDTADAIAGRALAHDQRLRCHNLIWPYLALPNWLTSREWDRDGLIRVMTRHIWELVTRYKGKCESWDVVNEALLDDGTLRPSIFLDVIGPDYISIAFRTAREADPTAKLYYNDYNIDNDFSASAPVPSGSAAANIYHPHVQPRDAQYGQPPPHPQYGNSCPGPVKTKIDGAKCLINMARKDGAVIDGIGLQGHYVYNSIPTAEKLAGIMDSFAKMDLDVAITELDVRMDFSNINEKTTDLQAKGYKDVLTACRITERCVGVTVWDFSDKYSWVTQDVEHPQFGSAHPWDNNMVRKQKIWDAMIQGWRGDAGC